MFSFKISFTRMRKAMGATGKVKDDSKPSAVLASRGLGEYSLKVSPNPNVPTNVTVIESQLVRPSSPIAPASYKAIDDHTFSSDNPKFYSKTPDADERAKGQSVITVDNKLKAIVDAKLEPRAPKEDKPGLHTFRVRGSQSKRKSITVNIGKEENLFDAEKIFEASQIRTKTYAEWKQEAKALLPSNTGGPPIGSLQDVIEAAPKLQNENDPRVIHRTIRRLSIGSKESNPPPKPKKPSRDYTKVREIHWKEEAEKKSSTDTELALDLGGDSDEEDKQERLAAYEKKLAGTDIKSKIQTLKQVADHLSNKRKLRHQLVQKATGDTVMDAEEIPLKEHILYVIEIIGDILHDVVNKYFLIWEKEIKEINGRFGIVNASYFIWLRHMIGLEIVAFSLEVIIVILPQMIEQFGDTRHSEKRRSFRFNDLVTGEGSLRHSYMYYTGYHARNEDSSNPFENPAFRFIFLLILKFILLTYYVFSRISKYYQSSRMESTVSGLAHMKSFKAIMCGWDFSCRDPKAKIYLHKTISRELKILVMEGQSDEGQHARIQLETEDKKILAFAVKYLGLYWGSWSIHIVGNILILAACFILGSVLYSMCQLKLFYYLNCVSLREDDIPRSLHHPVLCPNGDEYLDTWILTLPALFASLTTFLLTKFIVFVGDSETWDSPARKIYATMVRAGLFYFTNIGVFYYFWLTAKPELNREGFVAEAIFGTELYRLVVIQGIVDLVLNLGVKGFIHLLRRKSKSYELGEFRSEAYCLSMFFIHSVSRVGSFFCPPLGIFVILRLVLDFYQNKFILAHLSSPHGYSVHVSHIYAPFLLTFFILCYAISTFMIVNYLTATVPSNYDGPFENYNKTYDEVLTNLLSLEKSTQWIAQLFHPNFIVVFLMLLGATVYFCRRWALTYEPIIEHLQDLITLERADRDLLLKAIFEIGQVTGQDVLLDVDRPKKKKKPKPAKMKSGKKQTQQAVSTEDDSEEEEPEDHVDDHIDELINHVKNRKTIMTLETSKRGSIYAHYRNSRHSSNKDSRNSKTKSVEHSHKQHLEHIESIVARIVAARREKSVDSKKSLNPHHGHGHAVHFTPAESQDPEFSPELRMPTGAETKSVLASLLKNLAVNRSFAVPTTLPPPPVRDEKQQQKGKK